MNIALACAKVHLDLMQGLCSASFPASVSSSVTAETMFVQEAVEIMHIYDFKVELFSSDIFDEQKYHKTTNSMVNNNCSET